MIGLSNSINYCHVRIENFFILSNGYYYTFHHMILLCRSTVYESCIHYYRSIKKLVSQRIVHLVTPPPLLQVPPCTNLTLGKMAMQMYKKLFDNLDNPLIGKCRHPCTYFDIRVVWQRIMTTPAIPMADSHKQTKNGPGDKLISYSKQCQPSTYAIVCKWKGLHYLAYAISYNNIDLIYFTFTNGLKLISTSAILWLMAAIFLLDFGTTLISKQVHGCLHLPIKGLSRLSNIFLYICTAILPNVELLHGGTCNKGGGVTI